MKYIIEVALTTQSVLSAQQEYSLAIEVRRTLYNHALSDSDVIVSVTVKEAE